MEELRTYCKELQSKYPKTMNKDQFYQAAHISKSTALYLLQSGLVPCQDTGKKTRRYTIQTKDVIRYLYDREICPEKYHAENGWYSTQKDKRPKSVNHKPEQNEYNEKRLASIFAQEMQDLPDLLTISDLIDFIGCSISTALAWCKTGKLKAFRISGRYLIPKEYLIQYLASPKMYYHTHQTMYYKYVIAQYHHPYR